MTEIKENLPINVYQPWLRVLADQNLTLSNVVSAHRYTMYLLSDRVQAECGCCVRSASSMWDLLSSLPTSTQASFFIFFTLVLRLRNKDSHTSSGLFKISEP